MGGSFLTFEDTKNNKFLSPEPWTEVLGNFAKKSLKIF